MKAERLILAGGELAGVLDALLQRLRPALPQPRVAEPVGAQQRGQRDAAAHVAAQELERLVRDDDVVGARAVRQQPQHLADVGLGAAEQLRAQLVVLDRASSGIAA